MDARCYLGVGARLSKISYIYDPPIYDITSGCRVATLFSREAQRWTPDAIWGWGHDLAKFRISMIHRFMTSHPVAELLLCFRARLKDGRPMLFGFLVSLTFCGCCGL